MAGARGAARRKLVGRRFRRRNRARRDTPPAAGAVEGAAGPRPARRRRAGHATDPAGGPAPSVLRDPRRHRPRTTGACRRRICAPPSGSAPATTSGRSISRRPRRACAASPGCAPPRSAASCPIAWWCASGSTGPRRSSPSTIRRPRSSTSPPTAASSRPSGPPTAATCRTSPASRGRISTAAQGFGPRAVHRALGLLRLVGREAGGLGPVSEVHVVERPRHDAPPGPAGHSHRARLGWPAAGSSIGWDACCRCGRDGRPTCAR